MFLDASCIFCAASHACLLGNRSDGLRPELATLAAVSPRISLSGVAFFFKRRVFLVSRLGPGNSHPPEAVVFLGLESSFWAA